MNYTLWKAPDGPGGGFSTQSQINEKAGIYLYIEVESIEAALSKIEENGGKTTQGKTEITPEFGYYAIFTDVDGNSMGLWSQK
jgi:predicted enzyme related to lactoylglutathione lyase